MDKITSINKERFAACLQASRLSVEELADATHISPKTLSQVLEGEGGLSFRQVQAIASHFYKGVLYFVDPEPPVEKPEQSPLLRTLANQSVEVSELLKAFVNRAEFHRRVLIDLLEEIDPIGIAPFTPPIVATNDLVAAAKAVREWLRLPEKNNFVTYRTALEERGVLTFLTQGYAGEWKLPESELVEGLSVFHEDVPLIVVRKQRSAARQTFTLIHELAHLVLHRESVLDDKMDYWTSVVREREANKFAGQLLVPDVLLDQVKKKLKPLHPSEIDDWVNPVVSLTGASAEVVLLRLIEASAANASDYATYIAWKTAQPETVKTGGNRKYRYREPIGIFGNLYTRTVLEALSNRQITSTKASSFLDNLKIDDLRKLERHHAAS